MCHVAGIPLSSQKSPGLDPELYGHPTQRWNTLSRRSQHRTNTKEHGEVLQCRDKASLSIYLRIRGQFLFKLLSGTLPTDQRINVKPEKVLDKVLSTILSSLSVTSKATSLLLQLIGHKWYLSSEKNMLNFQLPSSVHFTPLESLQALYVF